MKPVNVRNTKTLYFSLNQDFENFNFQNSFVSITNIYVMLEKARGTD